MISVRGFDEGVVLVDPRKELHAGLWSLFVGATAFLVARLWSKANRRNDLWWDDYILIFCWVVVLLNDIIISIEFETGYVSKSPWDDRMHILINVSSCVTVVGQAVSKTAFAVTLLRMTEGWQRVALWFIIGTMNSYMFVKVLFQWARLCDDTDYDVWYRPNYCVNSHFLDGFKEGGNVYNILMDFLLALFPWAITSKLRMNRHEKISLAATMSLGMVVAIFSAVRTWWVGRDIYGTKDGLYFWRRAMSMIWFSAEITGTMIVQCIPILRPFLRGVHAAFSSKTSGSLSMTPRTPFSRNTFNPKSGSYAVSCVSTQGAGQEQQIARPTALTRVPEENQSPSACALSQAPSDEIELVIQSPQHISQCTSHRARDQVPAYNYPRANNYGWS